MDVENIINAVVTAMKSELGIDVEVIRDRIPANPGSYFIIPFSSDDGEIQVEISNDLPRVKHAWAEKVYATIAIRHEDFSIVKDYGALYLDQQGNLLEAMLEIQIPSSNTDQDQPITENSNEDDGTVAAKAIIASALERMSKEFGATFLPENVVINKGSKTFTIATDGKDLYINKDFIEGLNEDEITFILTSTDLKLKNNYLLRKQDRDPLIWNIACDYVVNAILIKNGVGAIPKDAMISDTFTADMTAEEVYDTLMKDQNFINAAYHGGKITDYQFATSES